MSGISSTLKDEIKKSQDSKHKSHLKFISCLLFTNALVAILCYPFSEAPKKPRLKILHPHHQMIALPLKTLVPPETESLETPITLFSRDKKIIASRAFLHESLSSKDGINYFKVEVHEKDLMITSEFVEEEMVAVPFIETKPSTRSHKKPGSKYEIYL